MDLSTLRDYCLGKPGTSEDMPFGDGVLVFRVGGKIFALAMVESIPLRFNLKCDPQQALELRERYESVLPGYHQDKRHWNTIIADGSVPARELRGMIDHSYELVAKSLNKKDREAMGLG